MLYFIGGASRSGKTIIAKTILQQKRIPYMSLDWLVMGFTNGLPRVGIHDKLLPHEIAERAWGFLTAMCESIMWSAADLVIEGEAVLPELLRKLVDKYPNKIEVCFMGYTDIDFDKKAADIRTYSDGRDDWLIDEPDHHIHEHIENMVRHSRLIKDGCRQNNFRFFDTSTDFISVVNEATEYLLRKM